jgi:hypothetical protein
MKIPASITNQLQHAIYTPAITRNYAEYAYEKSAICRQTPYGFEFDDINFLGNSSGLYHLQAGLYSAGHYKNLSKFKPNIVTEHMRNHSDASLIIGDSGGHQIHNKTISASTVRCEETYDWLVQYSDIAMTFDIPTTYNNHLFPDFNSCLTTTLKHLDIFESLGMKGKKFLNVLQPCENVQKAKDWYDAVKKYECFGWAFGGRRSYTLKQILWRIIDMIEDGAFDKDMIWFHFLGVGDLKTAVLLTAIQDALNWRFDNCSVYDSYDTTSPMTTALKRLTIFTEPEFTNKTVAIPHSKIDKSNWLNSSDIFPSQFSAISRLITKGDVIQCKHNGDYWIDRLSWLMLQNHNIEVQLRAVDKVNQLFKQSIPERHLRQLLPYQLIEGRDAIFNVLMNKNKNHALSILNETKTLTALSGVNSTKLIDPSSLVYLDNVTHMNNFRAR